MATRKDKNEESKILSLLSELGGQRTQDDSLTFQGDKFILPESYAGRPIGRAVDYLWEWENEQSKRFAITRQFPFHPYDVANAFARVLRRIFGTSGIGKAQVSFFGVEPPEYRTVNLPDGETVQVPWGEVELPILANKDGDPASFVLTAVGDRNGQPVGAIQARAAKMHRSRVEGLFRAIEADLKEHSLYRGRAMDANWSEPAFLDLSGVDESKVVYSAETLRQIRANITSVIEHADVVTKLGMPLKRAVLLEGPYGTGKSLTGYLTAQKAVANGWTFILVRPGQNLEQAMHAAKLYAPSVVFFEDLDVIADAGTTDESDRVSKLLDLFDGISNKSTPVMAVLTTNHVQKLHKGMLRPGRLDAVIHIGALDADGIERLVRVLVPEHLLAVDDFTPVTAAMDGFLPAFVKEATDRALRYSIDRTDGHPHKITGDDLVSSANGLRPQLDLMTGANEGTEPDPLTKTLTGIVGQVIDGAELEDVYGDKFATVHANGNGNGKH